MRIAIVGCGYSGAAVLNGLLNSFLGDVRIDVFDKDGSRGEGLAYQDDVPSNLLNRPSNLMYFSRKGDFAEWARSSGSDYLPRADFGRFVREALAWTVGWSNIPVRFFDQAVTSVRKTTSAYALSTAEHGERDYDAIVLATGCEMPHDAYGLQGSMNFRASGYRVRELMDDRTRHVGIIGCRLSAIDVALGLLKGDPDKRVTMLSRGSGLPHATDPYDHVPLIILREHVVHSIMGGGRGSLRTACRLMDQELEAQGIRSDLRTLMGTTDWHSDPSFKRHLYSVLASTNTLVPLLWHYLPASDQDAFRLRHAGRWNALRVPIPSGSRRLVDAYVAEGRLTLRVGTIALGPKAEGFEAHTADGAISLDAVVNATGPRTWPTTPLFGALRAAALAERHPHGGIRVDYDTCSVDGGGLFAVGQPTVGTYFSSSNIDVLQHQASRIVKTIEARRRRLSIRQRPRDLAST